MTAFCCCGGLGLYGLISLPYFSESDLLSAPVIRYRGLRCTVEVSTAGLTSGWLGLASAPQEGPLSTDWVTVCSESLTCRTVGGCRSACGMCL